MAISFRSVFPFGNRAATGSAQPPKGDLRQTIAESRLQDPSAFRKAQRRLSRTDRSALRGIRTLGELDGSVARLKKMTPLQRATRIVGRTLLLGAAVFGGIKAFEYSMKKSHVDDLMAARVFDDPQAQREIELRQMIQTRPELSKSVKQIFNADAEGWEAALNQRIQNPENIREELEARVLLKIVRADLPAGKSAQDVLGWLNTVDTDLLAVTNLANLTGMELVKITEVAKEKQRAAGLESATKNFENDYLQKIPSKYRKLFKDQFVIIAPGRFMMGSNDADADYDERPVHAVNITQPFAMQRYEMSQRLYRAVWGGLPSDLQVLFKGADLPVVNLEVSYKGADLPVVNVDWSKAQQTCLKIGGRLPTEAEWEMVASNYGQARYALPAGVSEISQQYANFDSGGPVAVMSFKPNPLGVFNLSGNVWEWVEDTYGPYTDGEKINPRFSGDGVKTNRGGAWNDASRYSRASNRKSSFPSLGLVSVGFRCVLPQDSDL